MKYEEAINAIEQFARDIKSGDVNIKDTARSAGKNLLKPKGESTYTVATMGLPGLAVGAIAATFKEKKILFDNLTREISLLKKGQSKVVIKNLKEVYDKCNSEDSRIKLAYILYLIHKDNCEWNEARKWCTHIINSEEKKAKIGDVFISEKANSDFVGIDERFIQHFHRLPYSKRRLLVPVESYSDIKLSDYNTMAIVEINALPNIDFPLGHPLANQLYVGHPYFPNKYIPFDEYELELLRDKVQEYCYVMQSLGAIEINIESVKSSNKDSQIDTSEEISAKGGYKGHSGTVEFANDVTKKLLESIEKKIQLHQTFNPNGAPKLPTGLVWYENEESWKRTYKQRMHGTLLEHEEHVETKRSKVVNDSELTNVSAEYKNLVFQVGGQWKESIGKQFETHDNAILAIKVKFAPLEELQGKNPQLPHQEEAIPISDNSQIEEYSEAEKEYMEEIKACLEESSEISPRERRLLNRLREKLGISEERAAKLESILQKPALTKEEKEYIEEIKACLEESSEISSRERRLLNRLREKLGISEERAAELEEIAKR